MKKLLSSLSLIFPLFASIPNLHVNYLNSYQQSIQTHTNEPEPKQINENQNTNSNSNQNTKINSSSINLGSDMAYSSEKTQATIGQGNIVVKDKENSDDIAGFPSIPQSPNDYIETFPSDNNANKPTIETIPGSNEQFDSVYTADSDVTVKRPTPVESEKYVGEQLGDEAKAQVSFKDGQPAEYGTKNSVRPDFCKTDGSCSIEVKNYNIATNQNGLINKVAEQAIQREANLPQGMTQKVEIDIRGQIVSKTQQDAIRQKIVEKSGGIIKFEDINFF